MGKRESRTVRVLCDVADRVQQLPHSDVDDAVPFRFHKRKNSGGHRNSDAAQAKQSLEALPFTSGAQRQSCSFPDPMTIVGADERERARGFPATNGFQFPLSEVL